MVEQQTVKTSMLPDANQLLEKLNSEHIQDKYIYRGQTKRYEKHNTSNGYYGDGLKNEFLYPSDFRFVKDYTGLEPEFLDISTNIRNKGRDLRDNFELFIINKCLYGLRDNDAYYEWTRPYVEHFLNDAIIQKITNTKDIIMHDYHFSRMMWSLAQHYYIATALVDITYDPNVSMWFAINKWNQAEDRPTEGTGVIYRMDKEKIDYILFLHSEKNKQIALDNHWATPPDYFLTDIRTIPAEFALSSTVNLHSISKGLSANIRPLLLM